MNISILFQTDFIISTMGSISDTDNIYLPKRDTEMETGDKLQTIILDQTSSRFDMQ